MSAFFIADKLNRLHFSMIKAIVIILAIIPISQTIINLLYQADGSSQIIIAFMGYTILGASIALAFSLAVQITTWSTQMTQTRQEKIVFGLYKQIPMLLLISIIIFICFS